MKTKDHDKKHKHKKQKHKKEKSRKERKQSSESESESEDNEWVESVQKKEKREEWMNDDKNSFDDFVPTFSKGGGERKQQKLRKSAAEQLIEKQLLQERELNPHWKNDGCGLPMQQPDDDSSSKPPSSSVGDCGYGWLKKAHERVQEQAKKEGRTMEDIAVERWGSLGKLEKLLKEAKERMTENKNKGNPAEYGDQRGREKNDDERSNRYRKPREDWQRSDYHRSEYSDSKKQKKDEDNDHRTGYKDSYRSSYRSSSTSESDSKHRSYSNRRDDSRESSRESKQFLSLNERDDRYQPAWKKKALEKRSPLREPQKQLNEKIITESSSHHSQDSSHQPAWKKKNFERSPLRESEKQFSERNTAASSSHRSNDSSHQPAWKKKKFVTESSTPEKPNFLEEKIRLGEKEIAQEQSYEADAENGKSHGRLKECHKEIVPEPDDGNSEDPDEETSKQPNKNVIMNRNELNFLTSRALRAEFWNDFKLTEEIERDCDFAKSARKDFEKSGGKIYDGRLRDEVVESAIDCYRLPKALKELHRGRTTKRSNIVNVGPFKKQYFDDKLSLKEMFQAEKLTTADDQLQMYVDTAAACKDSVTEEYSDDVSGKVSKKMDKYSNEEKDIKKAIQDYKRQSKALDGCRLCLNKPGLLKHTIVGKGDHVFICVPHFPSLVEGHCFIIPKTHVSSTLLLDEEEFNELQAFKRGLIKMFSDKDYALVFMETSINHRYFPHTVVECIPMPKDTADLAPMYFKKAIEECETEWSHNKKFIDLSKKDVRHSVPKGLPFFSVEFSFGGGCAHIVEDEKNFPKHFGKEIVGGILEIETYNILNIKDEPLKPLCKKVLKLVADWCKYKKYFEL